jgi:hypothetical protein
MKLRWPVRLVSLGLILVFWGQAPAAGASRPGVNLILAVDAGLLTRPERARAVGSALNRLLVTLPLRVRAGLLVYGPRGSVVVIAPTRPRDHEFYRRRLAGLASPRRRDQAGVIQAAEAAFGRVAGKRAVILVTAGRYVPRLPDPDWRPGREGPAIHVVTRKTGRRLPPALARLALISGGSVFRVTADRVFFKTLLAALDVVVRGGRLFLVTRDGPRPDAPRLGRRVTVDLKLRARHADSTRVLTGTPIQLPPGLYQVSYPGFEPRVAKVTRDRFSVILLGSLGRLKVRCLDRSGKPDHTAQVIVVSAPGQKTRHPCGRPIILAAGYHRIETTLYPGQGRQVWIRPRQITTIDFGFATRLLIWLDDHQGRPLAVRYLLKKNGRTVGSGLTGRPLAVESGQARVKVLTRPRPLTVGVTIAARRLTEAHLGRLARLTVQGPVRKQTFFVFLDAAGQERLASARANQGIEVLPGQYLVCPSAAPSQRSRCRPVELRPGQTLTVSLPQAAPSSGPAFDLPLGGSFFPKAKAPRRPGLKPFRRRAIKLRPLRQPALRPPAR